MADQFRYAPEVGTVVDGLNDLSARMTGHMSSAQAGFAGAGAPWGSDATGDKFATGSGGCPEDKNRVHGFVTHLQQWLEAMAARAETVAGHADYLAAAASVIVQADDHA